MVAKIKLEADNQTAAGFGELISALDDVHDAADETNKSGDRLNDTFNSENVAEYRSELSLVNDEFQHGRNVIAELDGGVQLLDKRTRGWNVTTIAATSEAQTEFRALREEVHQTLNVMVNLETERQRAAMGAVREQRIATSQAGEHAKALVKAGGEIAESHIAQKVAITGVRVALHATRIYATGALAATAAAAAPVVGTLAAIYTAVKTINYTFENTGKSIEPVSDATGKLNRYSEQTNETIRMQTGIVATNNRELANALNATGDFATSQEKLQDVMAATGKSAEELGVTGSSNASRMGDAFDELGGKMSEPFTESADAIATWWNSSNVLQPAIDAIDSATTKFTDNMVSGTKKAGNAWDDFRATVAQASGANRDEYRKEIDTMRELRAEHERLEKFRERTGDDFKRIQQSNEMLLAETESRRELNRLAKLRLDDIGAEENKLKSLAGTMAANNEFGEQQANEFTQKMRVLSNRRIQLEEEESARKKQIAREHYAERKRMAEEHAAAERERMDVNLKFINKQMRDRFELSKQTTNAIQDFNQRSANIQIDSMRHRMRTDIDALSEQIRARRSAGKTVEDLTMKQQVATELMYESERGQLRRNLEIVLRNADTEIEKRRAVLQHKLDIQRVDEREKIDSEQRKAEAVKAAADRELQIRLDARKKLSDALKGDNNQSTARDLINNVSKDDVLKQMTANRTAAASKGQNLTQRDLKKLEAKMRRQILHEDKNGKTDMLEVRRAQSQQANALLKKARADGNLSAEQAGALAEATNELLQLEKEQTELSREVQRIRKSLGDAQNNGKRRRAQRGN